MRLNTIALGLLLPVAAVLSGCGVGNLATSTAAVPASKAIKGKAFGGQQAVSGATIALYAFGTSGYGSAGTLLATSTTDADGYFTIDPASISCPTPTTPVYVLSIGGDPGSGQTNSAIMLGSALGPCADATGAFVTINEISTAMMAYTFSQFFTVGSSDGVTADHFGGPASATPVFSRAYNSTFTLLDVENGYPRDNTSTVKFEGSKLISLGNILAACVNSVGPASPSCSALFSYTTLPQGFVPSNTLEAVVALTRVPAQNTSLIYALQPQSGAAAFTGGLSSAPGDWTLSASYTSPNFGLGVDTRTVSTIDIDSTGRIWFPSNGPGTVGIGFFDPSAGSFSQLYPAALTHPQQVAIDADSEIWVNDSASSNVAGFPVGSLSSPTLLSLAGTSSTAVTVTPDNNVRYGIVAASGLPALAQVTNKTSYSEVENTEVGGAGGFIASSIASDIFGGFGVGGQQLSTPTTYDIYYDAAHYIRTVTYQSYQDAGQVAFTGTDYVGARGGYSAGADGICIWTAQNCYPMANNGVRHPSGLALDGAGSIWLADTGAPSIEQIPNSNGSYLNSSNAANNTVYVHDTNNGGTLSTPAGIAIDRAGNVWVSNYGCYGNGCTPGSFTLSEVIGAGAPTLTPVSQQVIGGNYAGTQPQAKRSTGLLK